MKRILFTFIFLASLSTGFAQYKFNFDYGIRAGAANYLGDVGSGNIARGFVYNMELKDTRWNLGGFARYRFHPLFAVQADLSTVRIQGQDKNSINYARRGRNLSFKNDLVMLNTKLEYYPSYLTASDVGRTGKYLTDYKTYFFAGVGVIYHSPKAVYNGEKYKLRKLMTEGKKYSPIVMSIPLGAGFYFTHKRQHRFGFEMSWNLTFTDYLDDVSKEYVTPSEMASDPMAAILANRNPELGSYNIGVDYPDPLNYGGIINGQNASQPSLNQRGDPTDKDNFLMISVSYSYVIKLGNTFTVPRGKMSKYGKIGRF